jgi:type IV pilus assembly protein PilA
MTTSRLLKPPGGALHTTYLKKLRDRAADLEDEGFTLIELLVVLLIIGILLAIAIPTFLTVTKGAKNTAAESNLNTALTAAETYYTQNSGSYAGVFDSTSVSNITQQGTGLTFTSGVTGASATAGQVDIDAPATDGSDVVLASLSVNNNRCYAIADQKTASDFASPVPAGAGVYFGYYTYTSGTCNATTALTAVGAVGSAGGAWQTGSFPG